ncbi:class I SAM-dependent methyltransferase [Streptomyces sp. NPDC020141]|uniref:class I SAM-dependent methyltransferase n=1 Tax=Streptomyces sp. NPDC020141 TaxID=3365065 RepID=UPI003789123F
MADTASQQAPAGSPVLREEILAYYERGKEDGRLRTGVGRLELWRTQDVLRRLLPEPPATILDVGDARALPVPDGSAEVVLMLGPLYHLTERRDRVRALAEARRAVRPGGLVVAATINRFAGLHDSLDNGGYADPGLRAFVDAFSRDGRHSAEGGSFTTAYFHEPAEVPEEFRAAGLTPTGQYGLEGAAWLMRDAVARPADSDQRHAVLAALRRVESVPSLLGISGHLLTAGTAAAA